jgi:anaerobic selenocysteine-containing dehydrogenase
MTLTRRSFAKAGALLALPGAAAAASSRVVIARDAKANVVGLLDRAMQAYFNCDKAVDAWRKVVQPGETVGLKVNCLAGKGERRIPPQQPLGWHTLPRKRGAGL